MIPVILVILVVFPVIPFTPGGTFLKQLKIAEIPVIPVENPVIPVEIPVIPVENGCYPGQSCYPVVRRDNRSMM